MIILLTQIVFLTVTGWLLNNGFEIVWKEVVAAELDVLYQHLSARTDETKRKLQLGSPSQDIPNTKRECWSVDAGCLNKKHWQVSVPIITPSQSDLYKLNWM
jgi:hypothetical protein